MSLLTFLLSLFLLVVQTLARVLPSVTQYIRFAARWWPWSHWMQLLGCKEVLNFPEGRCDSYSCSAMCKALPHPYPQWLLSRFSLIFCSFNMMCSGVVYWSSLGSCLRVLWTSRSVVSCLSLILGKYQSCIQIFIYSNISHGLFSFFSF